MRWLMAFVLLAAPALAGCTASLGDSLESGQAVLAASAVKRDPASHLNPTYSGAGIVAVAPPPAVADTGSPAVLRPGQMLEWTGRCPCPEFLFDVDAGPRWDGWVEARVRWDGTQVADLGAELRGPAGSAEGERGFDDRVARLWSPRSGGHALAIDGTGPFTATVRFGSLDVPADGSLRPNLVELVLEGPGIGSCDEVERTEQGAVKCLRFGNGVGNPGHGPVQVRLTLDEAAFALGRLEGRYLQELRQADGSVAAHEVGPASFHLSHGHWHYDGLATFDLFAVDPETGLRGALASSHGKAGFCFLDWDQMPENTTAPGEQERAETDCLVPGFGALLSGSTAPPAWTNGISRGWYDFYVSGLSDQYVDVAGVPDGLYELVATADPLGTLVELDETDNQSSVLLSLKGDTVEVLEERGHHRVQEDDEA